LIEEEGVHCTGGPFVQHTANDCLSFLKKKTLTEGLFSLRTNVLFFRWLISVFKA